MSFLTDEEKLELLMSAMTVLGKLYQDLAHAPALTLAHNSEVKKSKKTVGQCERIRRYHFRKFR